VAHGDVLTLSRGNRNGLKGFGSLIPVVSEWQDPASAMSVPALLPGPEQLQVDVSELRPDENAQGWLSAIPPSCAVSEKEVVETAIPRADPFAAAAVADVDTPTGVQLVSQTFPTSASDGSTVAPQPPSEHPELTDAVDAATSSGDIGAWKLVFIGGLLVAGTLILAASFRADEEPEADELSAKVQQTVPHVDFAATDRMPVRDHAASLNGTDSALTPPLVQISTAASSFADIVNLTSELAYQEAARTNVAPSTLVSDNEWFAKDWHQTTNERVPQVSSIERIRAEQGPTTSVPETPREPEPLREPLCVEMPAGIPEPSSEIQRNGFADLEDLLQNRLPIDLCSTCLPLRIALFGRPAGPRRLRIDAGHTTLAAPHMNRSADRERRSSVTPSEASSSAENSDGEVAGSFDRALQHLQERTDS
jgi:hypothetical protein